MNPRARRLYQADVAVIWISLAAMWTVLVYALGEVAPLAADLSTRVVIVAAALLAGVVATSALVALQLHLRRQRTTLYDGGQPAK